MPNNTTPESIAAELLADLADKVDTREGSYTSELIKPVALALYKQNSRMDAAIPLFYIDETSGVYIDKQCAWHGITRKQGARAVVTLQFTGDAGALVPKGSSFTTAAGLRFATLADAVLPQTAQAQAVEVGEKYEVQAGEICRQYISVPGVTAVSNPTAAQGGTDAESDAALFARLEAARKKPTNGANANQYEQWALEVDGVGKAKILPLKNGAGSVGVLLASPSGGTVDAVTVTAVAKHIESLRMIGVAVEVASARAFTITVAATVQLGQSTTIEQVRTTFTKNLTAYLQGLTFAKNTIPYNRVAYMLLDIAGVENYTALTINGASADITLAADQVPVLGAVAIT